MNSDSANEFPTPNHAEALKFLPPHIITAIQDYAVGIGFTENQVVEMAIANFLNLNAVTYSEIDERPSFGEIKARLETLEAIWQAAKEGRLTQQMIENIASLDF